METSLEKMYQLDCQLLRCQLKPKFLVLEPLLAHPTIFLHTQITIEIISMKEIEAKFSKN